MSNLHASTRLTPATPQDLPAPWHSAADTVASTGTGFGPLAPHEAEYITGVAAAVDRLRLDAPTRLLLSHEEIFREGLETALDELQDDDAIARRAKASSFLGPRPALPSPRQLAHAVAVAARTAHRDNLVLEACDKYARRIGLKAAEKNALRDVIVADLDSSHGTGDQAHMAAALDRLRRADVWKAMHASMDSWYPAEDERAAQVLSRFSTVTPGGAPPPEVPVDPAGNPDAVGAAFVVAEAKLENVAVESRSLLSATSDVDCVPVHVPCIEDEEIEDRICAAATAIQVSLFGEAGFILAAAEEARRQFAAGTLVVGDHEELQAELYYGANQQYTSSLDVVPHAQRQKVFAALGFTSDSRVSGNATTVRAFNQLLDDLNAYSAALCKGADCGRSAWVRVSIAIRRVRSQIATVMGEHTVLLARAMVRHFNAEVELLGRLGSSVYLRSNSSSTDCIDVWPAVRALLPKDTRDLDEVALTALAEAWDKVLALVQAGDDEGTDTHTVVEALEAAALIRPRPGD